jgi:5-methylcytosine-specific restriction endonuclease McrA
MKLYDCQFPNCDKKCAIRSKVKDKDSEYYGLLVCPFHANQLRPKTVSDKTRRTRQARQEQRKDYPEFYQKHIDIASRKNCEECGIKLYGNSTEIAHIIAKSTNPETATDDNNIIYLCQSCHSMYDSSLRVREKMKVIEIALERFKLLDIKNITSEVIFFQNLTKL